MAMPSVERPEQSDVPLNGGILLPYTKAPLPQGRMVRYQGLDVTYFTKDNFLRNIRYLEKLYAIFGHEEIGWSQRYATWLAARALDVNDLTHGAPLNETTINFILSDPAQARKVPSVVLLSRPEAPGEYIAFSAQRAFYPIVEGPRRIRQEVPVLGHLLRVVVGRERDTTSHLGRFIPDFILSLHNDVNYYLHRTGNFIAAYVNTRADNLDQNENSPWTKRYQDNPYLCELTKATYDFMRGDGPDIDEMGVARYAYREANEAIPKPDPTRRGSYRIWKIMHEEFGMEPLDGVVSIYRVANHSLVRA